MPTARKMPITRQENRCRGCAPFTAHSGAALGDDIKVGERRSGNSPVTLAQQPGSSTYSGQNRRGSVTIAGMT
jgi:hypothetical protein